MSDISLERQAQSIVQPHLNDVAWPTVFLGLACVIAFIGVMIMGFTGVIPLWLGLILNSFILYADQTPLHEAVHGSISGKHKRYRWLNHTIGFLCGIVLIHEYKMFRVMHTLHHRDTNNPEFDPDYWIFSKNPLGVALRCMTIPLKYHYYFFRYIFLNREYRSEVIHVFLVYWALYSVLTWGVVLGYGLEFMMLWYIPHFIASGLIIYFFGWLVHPEEHEERYKNTRILKFKDDVEPVVNFVWFFQTYHLIHHLFPRVPFYKYPAIYKDLKPILQQQGSPILEIGDLKDHLPHFESKATAGT